MAIPAANRAPSRRRNSAGDPFKKVTLRLRTQVADAVRAVIQAGGAPSTDAFVEDAIVAALRERRRQRLHAAYADAAQDSAFVTDMAHVTGAFDSAVNDGLGSAR